MASSVDAKSAPTGNEPGQELSQDGNFDEKAGNMVEVGESHTAEEERAVLRKIDLTILPMVCSPSTANRLETFDGALTLSCCPDVRCFLSSISGQTEFKLCECQ